MRHCFDSFGMFLALWEVNIGIVVKIVHILYGLTSVFVCLQLAVTLTRFISALGGRSTELHGAKNIFRLSPPLGRNGFPRSFGESEFPV